MACSPQGDKDDGNRFGHHYRRFKWRRERYSAQGHGGSAVTVLVGSGRNPLCIGTGGTILLRRRRARRRVGIVGTLLGRMPRAN